MAIPPFIVTTILSGGQTGVDRAALDIGFRLGIPIGGWCPRGRLAEDGPIALRYPLRETPRSNPAQRTIWNIRDADGTLILTWGVPTGGTALTIRMAERFNKPFLIAPLTGSASPASIMEWLRQGEVRILNVAGPRESAHPGTYVRTRELLFAVLTNQEEGRDHVDSS